MNSSVFIQQREALRAVYVATKMDSRTSFEIHGWILDPPVNGQVADYCNLTGVVCDSAGYVISLSLNGSGLEGTLPSDIGSLVRLKFLSLNKNTLMGTLPHQLLRLQEIRYLNLGFNYLKGPLPDFSDSQLRRLFLNNNGFSGTIPSSICRLHCLETLQLTSITTMWGELPACLGEMKNLTKLRIADMGLTGSIPVGLCNGPLGCDEIGCPSGSYSPGQGRQINTSLPCIACVAPSNVIASTICRWQQPFSYQPVLPLLTSPSASPAFSSINSSVPTSIQSSKPSTLLCQEPCRPTVLQSISVSPPAHTKHSWTMVWTGVFIVSLLLFMLLASVMIFHRIWRNRLDGAKQESETTASDPADPPVPSEPVSGVVPYSNDLLVESGDMPVSVNISSNQEPPKSSILRSASCRDYVINQGRASSRRVRFDVPEPLGWKSTGDEDGENTKAPSSLSSVDDLEAWISWLTNPLFPTNRTGKSETAATTSGQNEVSTSSDLLLLSLGVQNSSASSHSGDDIIASLGRQGMNSASILTVAAKRKKSRHHVSSMRTLYDRTNRDKEKEDEGLELMEI